MKFALKPCWVERQNLKFLNYSYIGFNMTSLNRFNHFNKEYVLDRLEYDLGNTSKLELHAYAALMQRVETEFKPHLTGKAYEELVAWLEGGGRGPRPWTQLATTIPDENRKAFVVAQNPRLSPQEIDDYVRDRADEMVPLATVAAVMANFPVLPAGAGGAAAAAAAATPATPATSATPVNK